MTRAASGRWTWTPTFVVARPGLGGVREPVDRAEDGWRLALAPLDRLELHLADTGAGAACAATYDGYLVAGLSLRELPAGSSLDRAGVFYWDPGPGFHGTYRLLLVRTACDGARTRVPITIVIR